MNNHSFLRWAIWFGSLALLCGVALLRVDQQNPIQTNVLNLLPERHDSQALDAATERSRNAFSQQLIAIVEGPDNDRTHTAAMAAYRTLRTAGLQAPAAGDTVDKALAVYQQHRFAMLTPRQIARLDRGGAKALATDVAASLASPAGLVRFGQDPGGYLAEFMANLPRPYPDFFPDGPLMVAQRGDHSVYLMRMMLPGAGFAKTGSSLAAHAVQDATHAVVTTCAECRFSATGAALFADAARHEGQRETIMLGVISTLLIMILIAFVFRSFAPHVLGFLQLFASVAAASAAVIVAFGSINILTLVFGTTLLGIAIDYAFLYFAEYWFGTSPPAAVMRKIRAGLIVGLVTGTVAFAFLLLAGFPALDQIAVFSIVGLLEAALVVVLIFPITLTGAPAVADHPAVNWPARFVALACRPTRWRYGIPALLLLLAIPGWFFLHASDDVRNLSHFPPQLMHTDQHIRTTLGRFPASGYFLIKAKTLGQALDRESRLFGKIDAALAQANPMGLSRFLPPPAQQQASLDAWQKVADKPTRLAAAFKATGLPPMLARHVGKQWRSAARKPLRAAALFEATPQLTRFVIHTDSGVALFATVFGDSPIDAQVLASVAAGVQGAQYVQPLERINNTFAQIRVRATWLVIIGYLLISGILVWRYGYRETLRMLVPPLLALGITLGALGWLREPVNVFVVVALILILGLGRDYAIFLREVGARERSPALSVTLSALATIMSFGLLSLSRIPALHAFGVATLIGIVASVLLAPLSLPTIRDDE